MAYSWLKARSTCGDVCVRRIGKSIWVLRSFFFFSNNTEPQTISGDHESSYHQASFVRNSMQAFGNSQNCFCLFFSTLLLSEFIDGNAKLGVKLARLVLTCIRVLEALILAIGRGREVRAL